LRAIAIGLVVLYHADLPFVGGGYVGVDVFFVISGFLITGHLLSSLDRDGRIYLGDFYARRVRRILPAAIVVLLCSVLIGSVLLPKLQQEATLRDAVAAALYVSNIQFARDAMNYLADPTPSLFQHYWSLGVEEQFYLVWPLLLLIGFCLLGRSKKRLFWMVAIVVAVSFAACLYWTGRSQPWAFFSLPTRFWELGVGGLVAFLMSRRVSIPPGVAAAGGWLGLGGIVAAGGLLNEQTLFPGSAAVLPVLATAMLIYCGGTESRFGPGRALSGAAMVFIGTISYSLYLVHWPLLIIAEQAGGTGALLTPLSKLGLLVAAVPIAYLSYRFVERPFQEFDLVARSRPRTILVSALVVTALVGAACLQGMRWAGQNPLDAGRAAASVPTSTSPIFSSYVPSNLYPSLRRASGDNPAIYQNGCHADPNEIESAGCEFGDPTSTTSVALFGDSHAAQWFPALESLALEGDFRLRVDTKSSCPSVAISKLLNDAPYEACDEWRADVIGELNQAKPDLVILS
ncbi:MAG: acyltransferase, partial [Pirellulaceae bacterium]|nr:acyltransferase [Pirellulaceae bacterium]